MNPSWQDNERLLDLLAKEATDGLSSAEAAELASLVDQAADVPRDLMESTVARLFAAAASTGERMPAGLRERILAAAPVEAQDNVTPLRRSGSSRSGLPPSAGWWAAAASLLLAVAGWWPRLIGDQEPPQVAQTDPQSARNEMLAGPGVMRVNLTAASDAPLTGDVVFDPVKQVGFLRFRGIPANDPRLSQYQLWIADAGREQPEPVDGGVFDVTPQTTASGDVIVPFRAKLAIGKPAAFVVTLEQPGGVVVSKQERVMALAKVPERQGL